MYSICISKNINNIKCGEYDTSMRGKKAKGVIVKIQIKKIKQIDVLINQLEILKDEIEAQNV